MDLTIHRGSTQIGGSCVELSAGGSRIILDVGMPLAKPGEQSKLLKKLPPIPELIQSKLLPDIKGLYAHEEPGVDALVLSHAHLDHYGLAQFVHPKIPIYMSRGTSKLLDVNQIFMPNAQPLASERKILAKDKPTKIGAFTVTGYLVDHSAPDALALLVEADGKRVFYSGDLRAHGRKKSLFEKMVRHPPKDIDAMLLEGTTLGRGVGTEQPDEETVEEQLVEVLNKRRNMTFLFCSAQNIDRLVSAFKAVRRTKTILVMDLYTAWVLKELSVLSPSLPQYDWANVRVKYWKNYADKLAAAGHEKFLYEAVSRRIKPAELVEKRADVLMLMRANSLFGITTKLLPDLDGIQLIWSMWEGYWKGSVVEKFSEKHGIPKKTIHTSGHASAADLQRLAKAVSPRRLIPIHTEHPDRYDGLFANVCHLEDGQTFVL